MIRTSRASLRDAYPHQERHRRHNRRRAHDTGGQTGRSSRCERYFECRVCSQERGISTASVRPSVRPSQLRERLEPSRDNVPPALRREAGVSNTPTPFSIVGMVNATHVEVDHRDALVGKMRGVRVEAHRELHGVRAKLALEERQARDTASLADQERLRAPLGLDAVLERVEVGALDVSEPPVRNVVDVDLQRTRVSFFLSSLPRKGSIAHGERVASSERGERFVEVRLELLDDVEERLVGHDPDRDGRRRPRRNERLLRRASDVNLVDAECRLSPTGAAHRESGGGLTDESLKVRTE